MSETIQIFDPATNQDERFPGHGEFDTAFIQGEDVPVAEEGDDIYQHAKAAHLENINLRQALRNSRRRTTNQRRELRRLGKIDTHREAVETALRLRNRVIALEGQKACDSLNRRISELDKELAETRTQLLETKIELVEEKSKKRGLFR